MRGLREGERALAFARLWAAKEAYVFTALGFLTAHGLPGTIASCTGARHASVLGSVTPGRHGLPRPDGPVVVPTRLRIEAS